MSEQPNIRQRASQITCTELKAENSGKAVNKFHPLTMAKMLLM